MKLKNPNNEYICCPIINCEELIDITNLLNENEFLNENSTKNMVECNSSHRFCLKCKLTYEHSNCENVFIYLEILYIYIILIKDCCKTIE